MILTGFVHYFNNTVPRAKILAVLKLCTLSLLFVSIKLSAETIQLTPEERLHLTNKEFITYCIDPDSLPYESLEKGQHIGMSAEYIKIFSELIDTPLLLLPTRNWSESLENAKTRECDILSLAMSSASRKEYLNFADPYMTIPLVVVTTESKETITDLSELSNLTLAGVKDYAFIEILKDNYPDIEILEVSSMAEGIEKVSRGEVFGYAGSLSAIGFHLQQNHFNHLKINGELGISWELGVAVRNDDPLLLSVFNKATAGITAEQHRSIINHWISIQFEQKTDYKLLFQILAGVAVLIVFLLYRQYELRKYSRLLEELSETDQLTKIYNRLKIDRVMLEQLQIFKRYQDNFSVILLDVDKFKLINDTHGHVVGDKVLICLADLLASNCREVDYVGRWGGEEFIILCPKTSLENALILGEKLRQKIESQNKIDVMFTSSFGITECKLEDDVESLLSRADDALYKAKESGRNRIISN